jgi:hypothetical protein
MVEGHHEGARDDVAAALADLQMLLMEHGRPSGMTSGMVDASNPSFEG